MRGGLKEDVLFDLGKQSMKEVALHEDTSETTQVSKKSFLSSRYENKWV